MSFTQSLLQIRNQLLSDLPESFCEKDESIATWPRVFSPTTELSAMIATRYKRKHDKTLSYDEFRKTYIHILTSCDIGEAATHLLDLKSVDTFYINSLVEQLSGSNPLFVELILTEMEAREMGPDRFLDLIYNHVLGRQPDEDGLNSWRAVLDGGSSYGQLARDLLTSTEVRERGGVKKVVVLGDGVVEDEALWFKHYAQAGELIRTFEMGLLLSFLGEEI